MPMLSSCLSCVAMGRMFTALKKTPCVSRYSEAYPDSDEEPAEVTTKADCISLYGMKLFERTSSASTEKADLTSFSSSNTSCNVPLTIAALILSVVLLALLANLYLHLKSKKVSSAKSTSAHLIILDGGASASSTSTGTSASGEAKPPLANV